MAIVSVPKMLSSFAIIIPKESCHSSPLKSKSKCSSGLTELGSIIDKALAVGKIEPRQEISVKSKLSGLVKTIHADIGDTVHIGDPLFDIAPDPTPVRSITIL